MMERIDFLGARGVGKSTLFQKLVRRRGQKTKWVTPTEARRKVAIHTLLDEPGPGEFAKAATCYIPGLGDIFVENLTRRQAERAFLRENDEAQEFFEYCLQQISGPAHNSAVDDWSVDHTAAYGRPRPFPDVDRSAPPSSSGTSGKQIDCVHLFSIFDRLKELCLLQSVGEYVVFDESLADSTSGLLAATPDESAIRNHFGKLPAPAATIHLSAPVQELVERLQKRANRQAATMDHTTLDTDELRRLTRRSVRIAEIGACTLNWRGAAVLAVDTTDGVDENIEQIEQFLDHL